MTRGVGVVQRNPKIGQRTIEMLSSRRRQVGTMTTAQCKRMGQLFPIKYVKAGDMPSNKSQTDV